MNTTTRTVCSPLAILVLLFATISVAWGEQVNLMYTGTGWDTTIDNFDDGYPVNMSIGDAKGSLGASRVEITGEWMPWDVAGVTCEGEELEFKLVFSASVGTFQNHSQLYRLFQCRLDVRRRRHWTLLWNGVWYISGRRWQICGRYRGMGD